MNQNKRLYDEWKNLISEQKEFYIYGAANTAIAILKMLQEMEMDSRLKGFIVTNTGENQTNIQGFPVTSPEKIGDKNVPILVPHTGIYKREISKLLTELQLYNVRFIHKYVCSLQKGELKLPADDCMIRAENKKKKIYELKTEQERIEDKKITELIKQIRKEENPDFSEDSFYQSFELMEVEGKRPTLYRLEKYKLYDLLRKEFEVLDIGCNAGFLDMTIASRVKSVTGVEYNCAMVNISNIVKEYKQISNCYFYNADFKEWYTGNLQKYDVIVSFAVHHWLNISKLEYMEMIDFILKEQGYFLIESHDMTVDDAEYRECIDVLCSKGYKIIRQDKIMDDGITPREFAVMQKR